MKDFWHLAKEQIDRVEGRTRDDVADEGGPRTKE